MPCQNCSTFELLSCLVGTNEAKRIYSGSLHELFAKLDDKHRSHTKLVAARELVQRMLREDLVRGSALRHPEAVREHLRLFFFAQEYESFVALFLDNRHRLIRSEELFRGSIDGASVHPREVVKRSLATNAAAVIFAHNHPSGVAEPSHADREITTQLRRALDLIEVRVLDHMVVGGREVTSLAEIGWI